MTKFIYTFLLLFIVSIGYAQTLPIDFETAVTFEDFSGGTGTVIDNPQSNGINTSAKVGQIVRDGGEIWAGSKILLENYLDFSTMNNISMKVFMTAPVGTTVKMKLEGLADTDIDVQTTVTGEWETLTWDFAGQPMNTFNYLVFMLDYGTTGDGSETSTFLFDDVVQSSDGTQTGGAQIDFPVNFESATVNYTLTDFGENASSMVADPTDANNQVIQVVKPANAEEWAGTTIGTATGFATNLPLAADNSMMSVRVWSPTAGTPILLKVENSAVNTQTCETLTNTTVAGEWETLFFDFNNERDGTATLADGLQMGWTYNMASIFFNFGTAGAVAGEMTYYFDDVEFGPFALGLDDIEIDGFTVAPNPTKDQWTVSTANVSVKLMEVFDIQGRKVLSLEPNGSFAKIDASSFANGVYLLRTTTDLGMKSVLLIKE